MDVDTEQCAAQLELNVAVKMKPVELFQDGSEVVTIEVHGPRLLVVRRHRYRPTPKNPQKTRTWL